ncbi:MAG: hypothetical protein M3O46_16740 [Myxococcota bacterium]|nr:hypothetical protein [Myxococcota bacterium]
MRSRYRFVVLLFLCHATLVTALTAMLVARASPSRESQASRPLRTESVGGSLTGGVVGPVPDARSSALIAYDPSPPQSTTASLPRDRESHDDAPDAAPPPVLARMPLPTAEGSPDVAGAAAAVVQSSLDNEATALRQLVAQLRQRSELLEQVNEELTALRRHAASEESRRQGEAEQKVARRAAIRAALGTLRQAEARLATGNSDGVDESLSSAEAALAGGARLDVEAARAALARGDLFQAGQYLAVVLTARRAALTIGSATDLVDDS